MIIPDFMTTIVKNFNPDLNFWDLNPSFKTIKLFNTLFEEDKSKKKDNSSQLMWAIAYLIDPNEANPWKNISEEDKKLLIADEYLENKKFNWIEVQHLIDEYEERCLTIAEKELVRFERKLVDRGNFINTTRYSLDEYEESSNGKVKLVKGTADQLDKMMLNTTKLSEQLSLIKDMLKQEQSQGSLRAGASKSASESGKI